MVDVQKDAKVLPFSQKINLRELIREDRQLRDFFKLIHKYGLRDKALELISKKWT